MLLQVKKLQVMLRQANDQLEKTAKDKRELEELMRQSSEESGRQVRAPPGADEKTWALWPPGSWACAPREGGQRYSLAAFPWWPILKCLLWVGSHLRPPPALSCSPKGGVLGDWGVWSETRCCGRRRANEATDLSLLCPRSRPWRSEPMSQSLC